MRKKRKRQPIVPWLIAVAALGAALWLLLANVVFVVRNVRVVGAGDLSDAEVVHLSGIRLGARVNAVDEERVHLDVENSGQLAFVSLEKQLPSTLVLTVRPRTLDALILQPLSIRGHSSSNRNSCNIHRFSCRYYTNVCRRLKALAEKAKKVLP